MSDLPVGWIDTTLGKIVEYGKVERVEVKDIPANAWILELEDIEKDTSRLLQRVYLSQRKSKSTKNAFKKHDVLYGKLRPYLNKVLIADQDGFSTTEIIPIKPNLAIDGHYLFYWLKTPGFLNYVNLVSYGLHMPRLSTKDGLIAPLILAPINEQKRIVKKLNSLLTRLESCRSHLKYVSKILKRFHQAVLIEAISGRLTEDWRVEHEIANSANGLIQTIADAQEKADIKIRGGRNNPKLEDLTDEVELPEGWAMAGFDMLAAAEPNALKAGPFGSLLKKNMYITDGYKIYGQEQVIAGDEDLGNYFISEKKYQELITCSVKPGDILVSLVGTIGRVLVLSENSKPGIINPRLVKLSLHKAINREYISYYLRSPLARHFFEGKSHGQTMDVLNLGILRQLPILLPPIEEQAEIVRRAEKLFAYADGLETRYQSATKLIEQLMPSLLAKAFQGELVEQDPNDEPAEKLLQRVVEIRIVEEERRKAEPRKKKEKEMRAKTKKKSLYETLLEIRDRLTPEDLFTQAGFDENSIDEFYEELRTEIKKKRIEEIRQGSEKVYLKVISK